MNINSLLFFEDAEYINLLFFSNYLIYKLIKLVYNEYIYIVIKLYLIVKSLNNIALRLR